MPDPSLKKASPSYQPGGEKFKPRFKGDKATRYKKGRAASKPVRLIRNIADTEDLEGRPVSDEYEYKLENPYQRNRPAKPGAEKATQKLLQHRSRKKAGQ